MDWDKVLTLLRVAIEAHNFPKLHALRNQAIDELETMIGVPVEGEEEAE